MGYEAQWGEGNLPLVHLGLLAASPERVLALRLALSRSVTPTASVLDAGCGSLGVLAITAARLGARRVVAVDFGRLDLARALARENGVADRIEWVQCDLSDLDDSIGAFDVIVGMIYNNDPRRDLDQQRLMAATVERFGRPGTAIIPDTVRYSVAAYDGTAADETDRTRQGEWEETLQRVEGVTGISLRAARELTGPSWPQQITAERPWLAPGVLTTRFGYVDRRGARQLTEREIFAEISYQDPRTAAGYPETLSLPVVRSGRLDTTVWRQDLLVGDLLIRSTETIYPVRSGRDVRQGDVAVLSTGSDWTDTIPLCPPPGPRQSRS